MENTHGPTRRVQSFDFVVGGSKCSTPILQCKVSWELGTLSCEKFFLEVLGRDCARILPFILDYYKS